VKKGIAFFMNRINLALMCSFGLAIPVAHAAGSQTYPSQAAALAALTAPSHKSPKSASGADSSADDDDDIQEIPADAPTTSDVQVNIPVAGETGQL
jgi:hypothetical protein